LKFKSRILSQFHGHVVHINQILVESACANLVVPEYSAYNGSEPLASSGNVAKLRLNFPFVPFKLAPNPPSNSNFLRSFFSGFFNQREKSTVNRRVDAFKAIAKDKQQGRRA